jgi:alpha-beta hydrolase superfamily lysophospholipase
MVDALKNAKWLMVLLLLCLSSTETLSQSPAKEIDLAVATLRKGYASNTVRVNGTTIHYVRGGAGPAIILLHGFPQDWYSWRHVMPSLAKKFTVIAPDLRGVGGSAPATEGYDSENMAEDIHQHRSHQGERTLHR